MPDLLVVEQGKTKTIKSDMSFVGGWVLPPINAIHTTVRPPGSLLRQLAAPPGLRYNKGEGRVSEWQPQNPGILSQGSSVTFTTRGGS